MNRVIFFVCLIPVLMLSCSDDKPTLDNTRWEYTESHGNQFKTHVLYFTDYKVLYTISSEPSDGFASAADTYEFEGNYVYLHPDVKLELYGGRAEFTCTGEQMIPKNKEAGGMVFNRK